MRNGGENRLGQVCTRAGVFFTAWFNVAARERRFLESIRPPRRQIYFNQGYYYLAKPRTVDSSPVVVAVVTQSRAEPRTVESNRAEPNPRERARSCQLFDV